MNILKAIFQVFIILGALGILISSFFIILRAVIDSALLKVKRIKKEKIKKFLSSFRNHENAGPFQLLLLLSTIMFFILFITGFLGSYFLHFWAK